MHVLLIAAALSNQLWFEAQPQAESMVITPMATLTADCDCQLTINVVHQGQSCTSNSSQSGRVKITGQQPQALASMRLDIPQDLLDMEMLKMSLQPIVENAVKHAWEGDETGPRNISIQVQQLPKATSESLSQTTVEGSSKLRCPN